MSETMNHLKRRKSCMATQREIIVEGEFCKFSSISWEKKLWVLWKMQKQILGTTLCVLLPTESQTFCKRYKTPSNSNIHVVEHTPTGSINSKFIVSSRNWFNLRSNVSYIDIAPGERLKRILQTKVSNLAPASAFNSNIAQWRLEVRRYNWIQKLSRRTLHVDLSTTFVTHVMST